MAGSGRLLNEYDDSTAAKEIRRYPRKGGRKLGSPNPGMKAPVRTVLTKSGTEGRHIVSSNYSMTERIGVLVKDQPDMEPKEAGPQEEGRIQPDNAGVYDEYKDLAAMYPAGAIETNSNEDEGEYEYRRRYMEEEESADNDEWEWELAGDMGDGPDADFGQKNIFPDVLADMDAATADGSELHELKELEAQRTLAIANGLPYCLYEDFVMAGYMPDEINEKSIQESLLRYYISKLTIAIKSGKYSMAEIKQVKEQCSRYLKGQADIPSLYRNNNNEDLLQLFDRAVKYYKDGGHHNG